MENRGWLLFARRAQCGRGRPRSQQEAISTLEAKPVGGAEIVADLRYCAVLWFCMSTTTDEIASQIKELPDVEKLRLVDAILTELDKPDPEIDRVWADEARKRWTAYKQGRIATLSYEEVMAKHRPR